MQYFVTGATGFIGKRLVKALLARRGSIVHFLVRPGSENKLWQTLDLSYFARHDAADIAWHARALWRHLDSHEPIVRARLSSVGEGLQVLVFTPDRPDLFARICGYFDSAGFSIQDAKIHTTRAGYALDTFQVVSTRMTPGETGAYRDLISLVEHQLRVGERLQISAAPEQNSVDRREREACAERGERRA